VSIASSLKAYKKQSTPSSKDFPHVYTVRTSIDKPNGPVNTEGTGTIWFNMHGKKQESAGFGFKTDPPPSETGQIASTVLMRCIENQELIQTHGCNQVVAFWRKGVAFLDKGYTAQQPI